MQTDIPINVIIIEDIDSHFESLTDAYTEIIRDCRKKGELRVAIEMLVEEVREITLREILVKDIQAKAKVLEEVKLKW